MMPVVFPVAGPTTFREGTFEDVRHHGGNATPHNAHDIMARAGTPVVAAVPGRVVKIYREGRSPVGYNRPPSESERNIGNGVAIEDADGWLHIYAHFRDEPRVAMRQDVQAGQVLGVVGSTGRSDGPHLHYSIDRGRERVNATDRLMQLRRVGGVDDEVRVQISAARGWARAFRPHGMAESDGLERAVWNASLRDLRAFVREQTATMQADLDAGRLDEARQRGQALAQYVHRVQVANVHAQNSRSFAETLADATRAFRDAATNAAIAVLPDTNVTGTALLVAALVLAWFFL